MTDEMRWTILGPAEPGRVYARCSCGTERSVIARNITAGRSRSCGCISREMTIALNTTHGMSDRPEHGVWRTMLRRCESPTSARYPLYGGRGIQVCEEWHDFARFFADMGPRPEGLSLDRINNDGNYEPGNCRWTTQLEQVHNSRPRQRCPKGHAYTPENTGRNERGHRRCLTCARARGLVGVALMRADSGETS